MPDNAAVLTRLLLKERSSIIERLQRILGSQPAAEDVTQNLWFRVQSISDHPPIERPRAYLFRLASNLAIDHLRKDKAEARIFSGEVPDPETPCDRPSPERAALDSDALCRLTATLAELSPRCQQVVRMRRIEGREVAEIAGALGISRQMIWRYMNEAMDHISDRMADPDWRA